MFSAFHYNANRGDKRFRQMYKSGEKRPDWNRELTFEDSISRARNNRHLLVEKFRQIQSEMNDEVNDDSSKNQEYDSSQETFSSNSGIQKEISQPISAGHSRSHKYTRGSISAAFDSNSCEGFDYSSSFKNTLGDNFTFHMENYGSSEDIFDKNFIADNLERQRIRSEVWDSEQNDYQWQFDNDQSLLCPSCNIHYMKMNESSLICLNCTLQIDLSAPSVNIKMIKDKIKEKLVAHRKECKERIKYKFKDEKLFIECKNCKKEFYIS